MEVKMTEEEWQPPADAKIWIVCAANRDEKTGFIVTAPGHHDKTMNAQIYVYKIASVREGELVAWVEGEQGFVEILKI